MNNYHISHTLNMYLYKFNQLHIKGKQIAQRSYSNFASQISSSKVSSFCSFITCMCIIFSHKNDQDGKDHFLVHFERLWSRSSNYSISKHTRFDTKTITLNLPNFSKFYLPWTYLVHILVLYLNVEIPNQIGFICIKHSAVFLSFDYKYSCFPDFTWKWNEVKF